MNVSREHLRKFGLFLLVLMFLMFGVSIITRAFGSQGEANFLRDIQRNYSTEGQIIIPATELVNYYCLENARNSPQQPFTAQYRAGRKRFSFIAAIHGVDKGTYSLIDREIELLKPQIVIVEGTGTSEGISPESKIRLMNRERLWEKTEAFYAVKKAINNGIPFIGGEPEDRKLMNHILEKYSIEDFAAFYILRSITSNNGPDTRGAVSSFSRRFLQGANGGVEKCPFRDMNDLNQWFENNIGKELTRENLKHDLVAPSSLEDDLITRNVSAESSLYRDRHLIMLIAELLNRFDRVLMVYGGGHFPTNREAFKAMLGSPDFIHPDNNQLDN